MRHGTGTKPAIRLQVIPIGWEPGFGVKGQSSCQYAIERWVQVGDTNEYKKTLLPKVYYSTADALAGMVAYRKRRYSRCQAKK